MSVPAARSGIAAAVVLGVGRAVGEAMAVMMAAGYVANMPDSLFQSVRFLTTAVASEMACADGLGAGISHQPDRHHRGKAFPKEESHLNRPM